MEFKLFSKKNLFFAIVISLVMVLAISFGTFSSAHASVNYNSSESNGWKTWTLEPGQTQLDVQAPHHVEPYNDAIWGVQDHHEYYWDKNNGIKYPQLSITDDFWGSGSTLTVHYISWCPKALTDVDYAFTVVAMNHQGEIEARFRATGDDSVSDKPCSEEIWQSDCVWGKKSIAHDPMNYNGVFYIEKVQVDD